MANKYSDYIREITKTNNTIDISATVLRAVLDVELTDSEAEEVLKCGVDMINIIDDDAGLEYSVEDVDKYFYGED